MKFGFAIFTISFLFIFQSCYFEPDGEYFQTIDSTGIVPQINIQLNYITDTIYVCKNESVRFSYLPNNDQINWTQFVVNGIESHLFSPNEYGSFELIYFFQGFDEGAYPLSMKVFTHSETGSIADAVGAEGYLFTKEWTLVITDEATMSPKVTGTSFVNGTLKVDWNMYKGIDFKSYQLYKEMPYIANSRVLVANISNQTQNYFLDHTYHGEHSEYSIVTNEAYWSPSVLAIGPLPKLIAENDEKGMIHLKWDIPPYYKNIEGYEISFYDQMTGDKHVVAKLDDSMLDSFMVEDAMIGYQYEFFLTPQPASDSFYDEWGLRKFLSSTVTARYGVPSPNFSMGTSGKAPMLYLMYFEKIILFDTKLNRITDTIENEKGIFRFCVSPNNRYIISVLYDNYNLVLTDLSDSSKNKTLTIKGNLYPSASVSNVGTGIFIIDQVAHLYDYLNEISLATISLNSDVLYFNKISPSGNYFFVQTYSGYEFFAYENKLIKRLANPEYLLFAGFMQDKTEQMVRVTDDRIEVFDCKSWTLVNTWKSEMPIVEVYNLDINSRKLFYRDSQAFYLLNLEDGTKQIVSQSINPPGLSWSNLIYNNGQILWSEGYRINIE